ncbi:MAG: histidine kinase [Bacteroidota bacterium]
MNSKLKILHLEDLPSDAELVDRVLKKGNIRFEKLVVDNKTDFEKSLQEFAPDIILSDHSLPSFNSVEALKIVKERGIDIPFILITSTVSEEFAVEMMREGACDYLIKDRLQRLPSAVIQAFDKFLLRLAQENDVADIKSSRLELRRLTAHLETIREEERTAMAREIHDELGQQLTGIKMDLSLMLNDLSVKAPVTMEKVSEIIENVDVTIKSIRKISSELRPFVIDDLGLIAALDWQCREFEKRFAIPCTLNTKLKDQHFEKPLNTAVFRIYQETLTNIARHSKATEVKSKASLEGDNLVLTITDNGVGFKKEEALQRRTLGIIGMKERAIMVGGELKIETAAGFGTKIILKVPVRSLQTAT